MATFLQVACRGFLDLPSSLDWGKNGGGGGGGGRNDSGGTAAGWAPPIFFKLVSVEKGTLKHFKHPSDTCWDPN